MSLLQICISLSLCYKSVLCGDLKSIDPRVLLLLLNSLITIVSCERSNWKLLHLVWNSSWDVQHPELTRELLRCYYYYTPVKGSGQKQEIIKIKSAFVNNEGHIR